MDVVANRVALSSGLKKGKTLKSKTKSKKLSKPTESVKSPPGVTKKKSLQTKVKKLKPKKEVLKETLKSIENGNSSKLYKKIAKPLEKVSKSKKSQEVSQVIKKGKTLEKKQLVKKIKKEKSSDNDGIPPKEKKQKIKENESKKQKVKETEIITQKVKKDKKIEDLKEKTIVKKKPSEKCPTANLPLKHVKKSVAALLKLATDEQNSNNLLNEEYLPIFLQVNCVKIPKTPSRQLRMLLPHTLVSPDDEVALFVKDLKRGRRRDHTPTVEHFEELLKNHKCSRIKTIIPINQLKNEYDQYELKRNLVNSYDHFLVDGRISGHVARLLGKLFSKKRKLPTSIKMGSKDLNHEIEYALSKTSMKLNSNGDSHTLQVGTTNMQKSEIVDNIQAACDGLAKNFPGGWVNIRSLRIKTSSSLAIPIYISMKNKNKVSAPIVQPKRPKAYVTHEGELTTLAEEATVTVTPEGEVTLRTEDDSVTEDEDDVEDDDDDDEDDDDDDVDIKGKVKNEKK